MKSIWKNHRRLQNLLLLSSALLFVAGVFRASALDPERSLFQYNCHTWGRVNGLPANGVNAIAQASDGRLWLGMAKGLVYFDGVDFRVINPQGKGGIEGKVITSLARRTAGGLWFGLEHGGFGAFDGQQFRSVQRPEWTGAYVSVRAVGEDHKGAMLLAATGLAGRLVDTNTLVSLLPTNNADVLCVCEDPQGRVWLGTADHGLFYWQDGRLTPFPDTTLRKVLISALAIDPTGQLWVGTAQGQGLRCYDATFQTKQLSGTFAQPKAMLVDQHGVLWIGTFGTGLVRYYHGVFTSFRKSDGLASDQVLSLAESQDGSLWVGTSDGLTQLSDVKFPIFSARDGLVMESCLAVAASPFGGIWAGTPNGVSYYHDGQFSNFGFNEAQGFRSCWVKRIFAARNGDVYFIGAHKNLDRFVGDHVVMSWMNSVWPRAVAEDAHGILVALGDDLMRIENGQLVPFRLANGNKVSLHWINDLLVARDDSIWVATDHGVFQVKDGVLHDCLQKNGMSETRYVNLREDDHGAIWATRQIAGLARFKDGRVQVLTHEQGLYEDFIYVIVPDKLGNFWMDSNRGIFRVGQDELNAVADGLAQRVHCTVYEGEDAVKTTDKTAEEYSGCRSLDGRIWFPSVKGVIMIDPAHVNNNPLPPAVSLERVLINGQEYSPAREPVVEPGPGNLEFDYSALDYLAPLKVQYRYRLEGYESEWVDAGGRRSTFYTNLKPGRYRFQVQACNADGVWNTTGASFALKLPHLFYQTIAFRVTCALALLGFGAYVWRVQHLRRRQAQLQQANALMEIKVRERTAQLAEANAALHREIDERKRAQAEIEGQKLKLEKEIEERKRMEVEVERVHRQLIHASRQAGQAEVASSVLHNVGNVLNSVNVSTTLLTDRLRKMALANVAKAAHLMQEHAPDLGRFLTTDEKGRKLPEYLANLGSHLSEEQNGLLAELKGLADNIEHIKEIVAMQQSYARVSGVVEITALPELVESALKMHSGSFQQHAVSLQCEFEEVPPIQVDRHKVLQILINVLRNAKYACDEGAQSEKIVSVRIKRSGQDRVCIEIADNGIGIAPENLTRIFSHGFTTRKDGHGFGLHSSALAAKELGGTLTAHSQGVGKGATFILELPFQASDGPAAEVSQLTSDAVFV